MATLTLDISTLSTLDLGSNGSIYAERGFFAEGLDTSVDAYSLLYSVTQLADMPKTGDAYPNSSLAAAQVQNVIVMGVNGNTVSGKVVYSSSPTLILGSYIFTRSSRQVQRRESMLPDGTALRGSYVNSDNVTVVDRYAHIVVSRSAPSIIIEGLVAGNPNNDTLGKYLDMVNSDFWQGEEPGRWLLKDHSTTFSRYQGQYQFRTVILGSPTFDDWSIMEVLHDPMTGQEIKVDPSVLLSAAQQSYQYGLIGDTTKGYLHIGPYQMTSFFSLGLPTT